MVRLLRVLCLSLFLNQAMGEESSSGVRSVLPGVGVKGVAEIGMTADEAKRALAECTEITETRKYSCDRAMGTTSIIHRISYDSEGILAELDGNGYVKSIQINVRPSPGEETLAASLSGELSFSAEKPVRRKSVVHLLGELEEVDAKEKVDRTLAGVDYRYRMTAKGNDIELMYYYSKGIYCLFSQGYLQRIGIFEKRDGEAQNIDDTEGE